MSGEGGRRSPLPMRLLGQLVAAVVVVVLMAALLYVSPLWPGRAGGPWPQADATFGVPDATASEEATLPPWLQTLAHRSCCSAIQLRLPTRPATC